MRARYGSGSPRRPKDQAPVASARHGSGSPRRPKDQAPVASARLGSDSPRRPKDQAPVASPAVAIAAAALLALAGCTSATTAPAAAPAPAPASAAPSESIDPGTLDAASAYLTALGKLDRRLVDDTRAALDHGQEVCIDVSERRTDAEQQKNVETRFAVDAAQASKILELTKANLCLE